MILTRIFAGAIAALLATTAHGQVAKPDAPSSKDAGKDPATVKCKTRTVTGSLAQTVKECHTLAEWNALNDRGRADADYYRQTMNSSRTN